MTTMSPRELDRLCINTLRFLCVDAVQKANSGHPGMPMGAAPMAYLLWTRFLRHNPRNAAWYDRDRFVLSAGHGSMLLYALLHLTGHDLPLEELKHFRQWASRTAGHPERDRRAGVETTTGPLGQGFSTAVGMAMAEAHLAARFNRPGLPVVDHFTWVLASDGDLMEGVASEAASLAGHLRLGKLICLYDDNRISLASSTDLTFTEDRGARFAAYGWQVQLVEDGNDLEALHAALLAAREERERPSLIIVRTHIGYGSPHKQDTFEAHGSPLGADEVRLAKERLGWPAEPEFLVPEEARAHFNRVVEIGAEEEAQWRDVMNLYREHFPEEAAELARRMEGRLPEGWDADIPLFAADAKGIATRVASGKVMAAIAARLPELMGGSADLNPSTHTVIPEGGDFQSPSFVAPDMQGCVGGEWGYGGRNIHFGVREHAMGAAVNGLAVHGGIVPYGATFLIFSDYLRPALRLSALMELPVVQVFTHDSVGLGEDGPTHQPVEHLAALRAIPRLLVIRPGDANETAAAWRTALELRRPVALALSRQNLPVLDRGRFAPAHLLSRGAYVLSDPPEGAPQLILMASGSELSLVVAAAERLGSEGVRVRVVSFPSWELFEEQTPEYRKEVLPVGVRRRLAVEAGSPLGWCRYTGDDGDVIGIATFGASAPGETVLREYGFTVDNVCSRARALLQRGAE